MTTNQVINLSFCPSSTPGFKLLSSSVNPSLSGKAQEKAGDCLSKIIAKLKATNTLKHDLTGTSIIMGSLVPITASTDYELKLTVDDKPLMSSQNEPLSIRLNAQFVKTLSGQRTSPAHPPAAARPPKQPVSSNGGDNPPQLQVSQPTPPIVAQPPKQQDNPPPRPQTPPPIKQQPVNRNPVSLPPSGNNSPQPQPSKKPPTFGSLLKSIFSPPPQPQVTLPLQQPPRASYEGVVPLENFGNDCFMNATFQVIMHDEALREALVEIFKQNTSPTQAQFLEYVEAYKNGDSNISTYRLRSFMDPRNQYGQQDANEFLLRLTNQLDPKAYPHLFTLCTTEYQCVRQAPSTDNEAPKTYMSQVSENEFLIPLQLPRSSNKINGQHLIDTALSENDHEGESFKEYDTTYKPTKARLKIEGTPNRLAFQLKRFTGTGKIQNTVDMPECLQINDEYYQLKSIIVHSGTTKSSGHYYSVINKESGWVKANDSSITPIQDISHERQNGYLYFYEKLS